MDHKGERGMTFASPRSGRDVLDKHSLSLMVPVTASKSTTFSYRVIILFSGLPCLLLLLECDSTMGN